MSLLSSLSARFGDAFESVGLDRSYGEVVVSNRPDLAQFQCNGALPAAKREGRNPRDVAGEVIAALATTDDLAVIEIAGPGFINLTLTDAAIGTWLADLAADLRLGIPTLDPTRTVIDFAGYNVAKAAHVGHMRPTIIGDSLQRIGRYLGLAITSDIHLGDWGLQMGMLIVAVEERSPDLPYFDADATGPFPTESPVTLADLGDMYPDISGRAADDPELAERCRRATLELQSGRPGYRALWQHFVDVTLADQRRDVDDLGVHFDRWDGESTVADRVDPLVADLMARGIAVESRGAVVVPVAEEGDRAEIPPMLLAKSDGAALYTTTDLATLQARVVDLAAEVVLYVVDARQALHFEQLFRAARKAGIAPPGVALEHIPFGTVNGPGGTPLRTRDGGLPLLRELIVDATTAATTKAAAAGIGADLGDAQRARVAHQVAVAALKFGDLVNHRASNYVFDLDRFTSFEGKTGPYLQYAAVRIASILRKAAEAGVHPGPATPVTADSERALILRLATIPEVVVRAWDLRAPNHIAEAAHELAGAFNRFYESCHILGESDSRRQASWLTLVATTLAALTLLLDLLGIDVPERM